LLQLQTVLFLQYAFNTFQFTHGLVVALCQIHAATAMTTEIHGRTRRETATHPQLIQRLLVLALIAQCLQRKEEIIGGMDHQCRRTGGEVPWRAESEHAGVFHISTPASHYKQKTQQQQQQSIR
jgi:hypothetical protein